MKKSKKKPFKSTKPKVDNSFREAVSLSCACSRDITLAELGRTYTSQGKERLMELLPHINSTFAKYGINTCMHKAHFLAQVGHETGQLRWLAEQLPAGKEEKDVYDGYKGRGLIQITYKTGYEDYGDYVGRDFTGDNRFDLEKPQWATDSAGWYWHVRTDPSLNGYAEKNDLIYITQAINGAFNGYVDRVNILKRAAASLLVDQCPSRNDCANVSSFSLGASAANKIPAAAFAWGLWHDRSAAQHGVVKSDAEAMIGYKRFLELKGSQKRKRFGFPSVAAMVAHAESRLTYFSSVSE